MCRAIEEMIEEATQKTLRENATETARNFFLNGGELELVKKSMTILTKEEIVTIYEAVCSL